MSTSVISGWSSAFTGSQPSRNLEETLVASTFPRTYTYPTKCVPCFRLWRWKCFRSLPMPFTSTLLSSRLLTVNSIVSHYCFLMSIATCWAYCFGVSPSRLETDNCDCVNLIFLGAVLRVAGGNHICSFLTLLNFYLNLPKLVGEYLAHTSINLLVVFIGLGLAPSLTSLLCNPSAKTCHFVVLSKPLVGCCPTAGFFIYNRCWGERFLCFFHFYRSFWRL